MPTPYLGVLPFFLGGTILIEFTELSLSLLFCAIMTVILKNENCSNFDCNEFIDGITFIVKMQEIQKIIDIFTYPHKKTI